MSSPCGLGVILLIKTRKELDMSKLSALLAIFVIAFTGCSTGDSPELAETATATAGGNATVKYDYDDDGFIDFVVNTHNGCVATVELFDTNGNTTGYKLEQPAEAPCMSESTGIETLMAFIDKTGGL